VCMHQSQSGVVYQSLSRLRILNSDFTPHTRSEIPFSSLQSLSLCHHCLCRRYDKASLLVPLLFKGMHDTVTCIVADCALLMCFLHAPQTASLFRIPSITESKHPSLYFLVPSPTGLALFSFTKELGMGHRNVLSPLANVCTLGTAITIRRSHVLVVSGHVASLLGPALLFRLVLQRGLRPGFK
jgi:hypothetical protein